ncbi:unnamed protein product [Clavelina lepadiformis]|uniref:Uncharacterized protein n=1 Tax=Clavelina lepadiformis TaxID=159417 RepID=A0ABP0GM54_CLALP
MVEKMINKHLVFRFDKVFPSLFDVTNLLNFSFYVTHLRLLRIKINSGIQPNVNGKIFWLEKNLMTLHKNHIEPDFKTAVKQLWSRSSAE